MHQFFELCKLVGIPISAEKTECLATHLVFLGMLLDGNNMIISIPIDKKERAFSMLNLIIDSKKATVQQLQSLCSFLNFLNKAILPGWAFTHRMYAKFSGFVDTSAGPGPKTVVLKKHHHIHLDQVFKADCEVWLQFLWYLDLSEVVNRSMVDVLSPSFTSEEVFFYSDANAVEDLGFGCVYDREWIYAQWEPGFIKVCQPSIEYLELFALCAGVFTWQEKIANCRVTVFCNNTSVVTMINKLMSGCRNCMCLICLLTLNGLRFNRRLYAVMLLQRIIFSWTACHTSRLTSSNVWHQRAWQANSVTLARSFGP